MQRLPLLATIALALSTSPALPDPPFALHIEKSGSDMILSFPSDPDSFYVLRSGLAPDAIDDEVALALGTGVVESLIDAGILNAQPERGFYRLEKLPRSDPQDLDNDGICDVLELENPFLDPLNPADAAADFDSDGFTNRQELVDYRTNPTVVNVSATPPILVGLSLQAAKDTLALSGMSVGVITVQQAFHHVATQVRALIPAAPVLVPQGAAIKLEISLPLDSNKFIDQRNLVPFNGSEANSQGYYNTIDPLNTRTTFAAWKAANGFTGSGEAEILAAYFNEADLGFGRRMFMRRDSNRIAYYVVNYATANEAAQGGPTDIATVAMEYSPHPVNGGEPYVKFFTFNGNHTDEAKLGDPTKPRGARLTNIDLDGREAKYQPGMCMTCHGGTPRALNEATYPDLGRTGARFIPFDLDSFTYSTLPGFSRSNQEESFRQLNEGVLASIPARRFTFSGEVGIPDDHAPGVNIPLVVTGLKGTSIANLDFSFDGLGPPSRAEADPNNGLDHTYVGDLIVTLTSPAGTTVTLINRMGPLGVNAGENLCHTRIDDQALSPLGEAAIEQAPFTGSWLPHSPLSAFDGEDPNGTWQLNVSDHAEADLGSVNQWSLHLLTNPASVRDFAYSAGAMPIPDNDPGGVEIHLVVPDQKGALVSDLDFSFDGTGPCSADLGDGNNGLTHSFVGDLRVTLTSPAGTTVTLIDSIGNPAISPAGLGTDNFCHTRLDDEASTPLEDAFPLQAPFTGTWTPAESLMAFDGQPMAGTWKLKVTDLAGGDLGFVSQWSLHITPVPQTDAVEDLIQGWYGGATLPNDFDSAFVPDAWLTPRSIAEGGDAVYRDVFAKSCRACHVMLTDRLPGKDFATYDEFSSRRDLVRELVYARGIMPMAKRTSDKFWTSVDRSQADVLAEWLDAPNRARYTGPPVTIPDLGGGPAVTQVNVSGLAGVIIHDLDFSFDGVGPGSRVFGDLANGLTHSYVGDLVATLTSPEGTGVLLVNRQGGSGNNFFRTRIDQQSELSIAGIFGTQAPYIGTWRTNDFTVTDAFAGENPNGVWTLSIQDHAAGDVGSVNQWSLHINSLGATTGPGKPRAVISAPPAIFNPGTVVLDGTGSLFAGFFEWTMASAPAGSSAVIANPNSATASFVADEMGTYTVALNVASAAGTHLALRNIDFAAQVSFANSVVPIFQTRSPACAICHNGTLQSGNMNLAAPQSASQIWAELRTETPDGESGEYTTRAIPGNPSGSLILLKPQGLLSHGGANQNLTPAEIQTLTSWIAQGALDN